MEKPRQQKENQSDKAKSLLWDCGSSLYDSFELKSFERQLDSALASRTLSMPHLPDRRVLPPPPPEPVSKKSSKISRSIQKLLRSVFRPKQNNSSLFRVKERSQERFYAVYDKSSALSTIPEVPENAAEYGGLSPEFNSLVRRTASDRFKATSMVIYGFGKDCRPFIFEFPGVKGIYYVAEATRPLL
ncbi:hypothetical protein F0562_011605 [Nyssa sinensis]|uniref:Uncharacterized protein n=1 Tax=Nyssa sinensis TaxID=561372 RepID=A0A5J4ZU67_9ASTE|nr:hypothetical protein F0562_011605 [Nyssa sinensis]